MTDNIGTRVRQAREQRGLSLGDAARSTKLSTSVLRAIEQNDFASLPAGMYRKAYLRTVASEVGLDPLEIAADYEAQYEAPIESTAPATETVSIADRWVELLQPPRRPGIALLIALATFPVAWLMVQPAPGSKRLASELGSPTESPVRPTVANVQRTVAAPTVQSGGPDVATGVLKIALVTTGWCWIAAQSDGERVVYGLIEPGKRVVVEGQRLLSLRLGDAGSVQLSINDGPSRTAGADGEVIELEVTADDVDALRDGGVETES